MTTIKVQSLLPLLCTVLLLLMISAPIYAQQRGYKQQAFQTSDIIPDDIILETMARLPQVKLPGALDDVGRQAYDTVEKGPGTGYENGPRGPVAMWLHSPVLAEAIFDVRQL